MYDVVSKTSVVVQKYGGTSVGSLERIEAVAKRVSRLHKEGWGKLVVVVSAMAGETNRLSEMIHSLHPGCQKRHFDVAVSAGEQISAGLLAVALEKQGLLAQTLLAYQMGMRTDDAHGRARIRSIERGPFETIWAKGAVPVVAGYQGLTRSREIATLGRGGSDTSAVAIAAALGASFCEINTDVDGVYTADPRVVPNAQLVERIDYDTALEMAACGTKVLHNRAVELAAKYRLPVVVRNSFKKDDVRRTVMEVLTAEQALEAPVVSGVSVDEDVARVTLEAKGDEFADMTKVFAAIADEGVNVDIIVHNQLPSGEGVRIGFTVSEKDLPQVKQIVKRQAGSESWSYEDHSELAKITVVGLGMRSYPGVASRMLSVLTENQIDISMISTSEIKIACVVPRASSKEAAQKLHAAFVEDTGVATS